jgi:hypothetical protein
MRKGINIMLAALTMCGVTSAYAVCYSLRHEYCVTPGSTVGAYTYSPSESCYPGSTNLYAETDTNYIEQVDRCSITWSGYPDVPYSRQTTQCYAYVYYIDCWGYHQRLPNPMYFNYWHCSGTCP